MFAVGVGGGSPGARVGEVYGDGVGVLSGEGVRERSKRPKNDPDDISLPHRACQKLVTYLRARGQGW